MSEVPPAQLLKDKYIPIEDVQEKCNVTEVLVRSLISQRKLRYAEFVKPGAYKRTIHINPDDLYKVLEKEGVTPDGN